MGGMHDKSIEKTDKQSLVIPKSFFSGLDLSNKQGIEVLKDAIANHYDFPRDKIITYDEMMKIPESKKLQYYVIVGKGAGDDAAVRGDVIGTLLLMH
jgi:hypothetical protein